MQEEETNKYSQMTDSLFESPLMLALEDGTKGLPHEERQHGNPKELTLNLEGTGKISLTEADGIRGGPPTLRDLAFETTHDKIDADR